MKIQYCSDLHLEFPENRAFIKKNPLQPEGEILLLAGDIVPFIIMNEYSDFFDYVADHFQYTYWIPGNHEYYHFDLADKCGKLNEKIRSNVFLVNNVSVEHDDVRIILSTLWSEISPMNQGRIENGLNDFRLIKYKGARFSSQIFNALYQENIEFIRKEVDKTWKGKTVVVTHHVPTFMNYPEEYKSSPLNQGFAVELSDFIETSSADYWIYGHHHRNITGFTIGNTELLTNQLGYVSHNEHGDFKNDESVTF